MRIQDLIALKRDGASLSTEQIQFFIKGVTEGTFPDYQIAALLMAIYIRGMNRREIVDLTLAMAHSGEVLNLEPFLGYTVDKHSSGGVGDKTTLVVLPLVASLGVPIAKMSGRGLGFSGGTIDKLEAIPGFTVEMTADTFIERARQSGFVLAGQSVALAPADGKLYALRDVTETVSSLPLIASSIMSKKIAAGASGIVLDVKVGSGAFMKTLDDARALARIMVDIGVDAERDVVAVLSDMNQPLGCAVGNALEVREAIETLQGQGPEDFYKHCLIIGSWMLRLAGQGQRWNDIDDNQHLLAEQISSGAALDKLKALVISQGGDARIIDEPDRLPQASIRSVVSAPNDGYISQVHAESVGRAAVALGAGREKKSDQLDLAVGLNVHVKVGQAVRTGQPLITVHANERARLEAALALVEKAVEIAA
ncbi:MAG: thymidine phosphorylase, partial [Anaerolinea sp.]|nr:thymidine phosphorylase [Anaerolinea sp.]